MRKLLAMLLALCMLLSVAALAHAEEAAEERVPAHCDIEGHYEGDGLDHYRARPCWVYGHTNCDGRDHGRAECKIHRHYACDGEDHSPAPCGAEEHFVCDYRDSHATPVCGMAGHCVSDGLKHSNASCGIAGHFRCDQQSHYLANCNKAGHYDCDGGDHAPAVCGKKGHFNCDGLTHEAAPCGRYGHCISDGLTHTSAPCGVPGHCDCDGRDHNPAPCGVEGHFSCAGGRHYNKPISEYCNAVPQHVPCQGNPEHFCDPNYGGCGETYLCSRSNNHTACRMCGLLWCDKSLGGHDTPCKNANHRPCVYTMKGRTYVRSAHEICGYCGSPKCDGGDHGNGKCVQPCPFCGYPLKYDGSHYAPCRMHYDCQTAEGPHKRCECGENFACNSYHKCVTEE